LFADVGRGWKLSAGHHRRARDFYDRVKEPRALRNLCFRLRIQKRMESKLTDTQLRAYVAARQKSQMPAQ
jgi:hypothetical protein